MTIVGLNRPVGVERQPEDFYATHPCAIPPLMEFLGWTNGGKRILEPACGAGHLSFMMETYGHDVTSTDLIDRGYGTGGIDFLTTQWPPYDAVITNPPYKFAEQFIRKSFEIAPTVCMFLRLVFLESRKRQDLYQNYPPRYVCVFVDRVPSSKDGLFLPSESSTVCYAWFIWERGFKGRPEIVWLNS